MSTRYVWNKHNRQSNTGYETRYRSKSAGSYNAKLTGYSQGSTFQMGSSYGVYSSNGQMYLSGTKTYTIASSSFGFGYMYAGGGIVGGSWSGSWDGLTGFKLTCSGTLYVAESYSASYTYYTKGSQIGPVTAANAGQYPADNYSGSYWYVKSGQDNIDPVSVTIPDTIMGGQEATITVIPSTSIKYGGTVSYTYQYQLDGGSWVTLEVENATATTQQLTVPKGTNTVAVRVQAKDDLGFTSSTWINSATTEVINNLPPTAPGSIKVTNVVQGENATITITAATDPDGTVARYVYERSVDSGLWEQIADVNALTLTDRVGEWAVVAYRAKAVDNEGAGGPYVIAEQQDVNVNWIYISGPNADMGDKSVPFNLALVIGVSGHTKITDINVEVQLDGVRVYSNTVPQGTSITIPIDTRTMSAGQHTIQVTATKSDYLGANNVYTFTVPSLALPAGGYAQQLQDAQGQPVFPVTTARYVIGDGGQNMQEQLDRLSNAGRGKTGHLEFVDAILGPVSQHQLSRAKDAVYAAAFFGNPGSAWGQSVSIPASYNGEIKDTSHTMIIQAAAETLAVTLPAGVILRLYQYILDTEEG